jgi:hypothetical protein
MEDSYREWLNNTPTPMALQCRWEGAVHLINVKPYHDWARNFNDMNNIQHELIFIIN